MFDMFLEHVSVHVSIHMSVHMSIHRYVTSVMFDTFLEHQMEVRKAIGMNEVRECAWACVLTRVFDICVDMCA